MFQNKMLQWLIIVLIAVSMIALASFVLWDYMERSDQPTDPNQQAVDSVKGVVGKPLTAVEIKDFTVRMDDVLTNLSNKTIVKISFAFEMDNIKAKEEFELLDFRVRSLIINALADMSPDQIQGSVGKDYINTTLMNEVNTKVLTKGKLREVYITNFILN